MKIRLALIVVFLVAGLAMFSAWRADSFIDPLPTATVDYQQIDIEVDTTGKLDAARSHTISSSIRGDKGKIIHLVEDGSHVKTGDVLVRLDPAPFDKELRLAAAKVNGLKAALNAARQVVELEKAQVERGIKTVEFNLRVAKLELSKLVDGTGPIQLALYKEEVEKDEEQLLKYESYLKQMQALADNGEYKDNSEIYLAKKKLKELRKKYETSTRKLESYKLHVLPTSIESEKAKVEKAEMELGQVQKSGIFKIAKAMAEVQRIEGDYDAANANLQLAQKAVEQTVITAPFSGIAIHSMVFRGGQKRKSRVGDMVLQNQPILFLPDISTMIVKAKIREVDLYKVKVGQPCTVYADAYPHATFRGEVSFIGALATEQYEGQGGSKYFRITISLQESDQRLRPGMTGRASITTTKDKKVLVVPIHAVFREEGQPVCYRKSGGNFEAVPVALGVANENVIEVVEGLGQGDRVSLVVPQ